MARVLEVKNYVDKETGQVISTAQKDMPEYFNPDTGYKMMARTKNIRMFPDVKFPNELSRTDMGHLLFLSRSMWANTGVVGERVGKSFKPFDDDQLLAYVGFGNSRRGKEWLVKMSKLSMLRSADLNLPDGSVERHWYINPIYFCPMFISRQSYLIWKDQVSEYLPNYIKKMFE